MANLQAACLYQETRLNLDPARPGSTVDVLLPANGASSFAARSSPKRRRLDPSSVGYDEETFTRLHLATESSIHFRPHAKGSRKQETPRAILWRILDDRKVLELQTVDLAQDATEQDELLLTLNITFPHAIRPTGVAFAEDEQDSARSILTGFVVLVTGQLFSLDLRKEFFVKGSGAPAIHAAEWWTSTIPSAFTHRTPYRLLARSGKELWATLSDGSLVRFEREETTNAAWRETNFTEGTWKNAVRGLLAWKSSNAVRFEDADLHGTAAMSIAASPDGKHIWTVCLDHTLKAWNVATGRVTFVADLSNDKTRDLQKPIHALLDPTRSELLQIAPTRLEGEYVVVTFSANSRAFKFWIVKDADAPAYGIEDMVPEKNLIPPVEELVDATIWTLEAFQVRAPHTARSHKWDLWLLTRCGTMSHIFHIAINLNDHIDALNKAWRQNWSWVLPGFNSDAALRHTRHDPSDLYARSASSMDEGVEQTWQEYLFYPGSFTTATLQTALDVYWKSLGRGLQNKKNTIVNTSRPLQDQIAETMALSTGLIRDIDGTLAFENYSKDLATQWEVFYGVVRDLHKRREQVLHLVCDQAEDLPWLVMADQISPVRVSSELEIIVLNQGAFDSAEADEGNDNILHALVTSKDSGVGQLLNATGAFRDSFTKPFLVKLLLLLYHEVLQDLSETDSDLITSIYDRAEFAGKVSDEDYNRFLNALDQIGGFASLGNDIFTSTLALLNEAQRGHHTKKQLTRYGTRELIRGAQETLHTSTDVVFSLLLLIIFIGGEVEEGDLPNNFDTHAVFVSLMQKMKELSLLNWLAGTISSKPSAILSASGHPTGTEVALPEQVQESEPTTDGMTMLELMFLSEWQGMTFPTGSQSMLLTYACRAWTFGPFSVHEQYDIIATGVMGTLLAAKDLALANEFLKFVPETPWGVYLSARLYMARGDFADAALYLEDAAEALSEGKYFDLEQHDSARLLDAEERSHFNDGLPRFYQHVVVLFEHAGVMSYVADFAERGLTAMGQEEKPDTALRSDLLARLFTSTLQTHRFEAACNALSQYTDHALLKASINQVLKTLLSTPKGPQLLLTLPIPAPEQVDAYLTTLASTSPILPPTVITSSSSSLFSSTSTSTPSTKTPIAYHKLLHAYRLHRSDLRGAASALHDRLQLLRQLRAQTSGSRFSAGVDEVLDAEIAESYLALLNVLCLMDEEQAWILARPVALPTTGGGVTAAPLPGLDLAGEEVKLGKAKQLLESKKKDAAVAGKEKTQEKVESSGKRHIVTLKDMRKAWSEELDWRADFRAGRVPFLNGKGTGKGKGKDRQLPLLGDGRGDAMEVDVFA